MIAGIEIIKNLYIIPLFRQSPEESVRLQEEDTRCIIDWADIPQYKHKRLVG